MLGNVWASYRAELEQYRTRKRRAVQLPQRDQQVCDPQADYYLGMEDYPAAIHSHLVVIREHPDNALAHYHLGFAYGVIGQHQRELQEYRRAVDLGLDDWQVFLNLGLVYLEEGQLQEATQVLRLATLLGPYQAETHFNLGLTYERRGMLIDAEREMLFSLRLNPHEVDARNMLGLIYAEQGRYPLAREEWSDLLERRAGLYARPREPGDSRARGARRRKERLGPRG